jgi:3'(2'), 5'-bisphosphate nucleotidase
VLASRSHGDARELAGPLAKFKIDQIRHIGSSLKFGLIACGEGDFYPRYGPTMEWDIAAGHAVLAAAGGDVVDLSGDTMTYGKPEFRNPGFIAFGQAPPHVQGFANHQGFR